MPITQITQPPSRNAGLSQDAYSAAIESTLNTMKTAVDDINANASQYNVATSTTSTSNVLIGTGAKTFTVPSGLGFVVGMTLRIANTSANFMTGEVTSYTTTSLVMNITSVGGSGTFASWNISMAAVGASTAASVSNTPAGSISSTTVQAAINELDSEKLSSAANAVTDTNLSTVATGATVGDSFSVPVVTFTSKGRVTGVTTAAKITSGTAIPTTSGTSHDFTGIPSGAKRITVMWQGGSTSGTSNRIIRLGSTTFATTGYLSAAFGWTGGTSGQADTSGMLLDGQAPIAATAYNAVMTLVKVDGNTWMASGTNNPTTGTVQMHFSTGSITLGGVLDRIRLTTVNGTDTFDAGLINILVE